MIIEYFHLSTCNELSYKLYKCDLTSKLMAAKTNPSENLLKNMNFILFYIPQILFTFSKSKI